VETETRPLGGFETIMIRRRLRSSSSFLAAFLAAVLCFAAPAQAISLIRDAEIEHTIRMYSEPIFRAAGLNPEAIQLHLVNDNSMNAFVAGGQRMFINTGMIRRTETPNMLIGVIAHETGHIAGGHLVTRRAAMEGNSAAAVLSFLLGIGAVAAGAGDVGTAIMAGGSSIAQRNLLQYTRAQEASADQAAMTYLNQVGWSGEGLVETFSMFRGYEVMSDRQQDPYLRSHPLNTDRMNALEERVEKSPYKDKKDPPEWQFEHDMIRAKLAGFLDRPAVTMRRYPESDTSAPARYARAVAYHKSSRLDNAMEELEPLIAEYPDNPFLWELKGQILFESGKAAEAIAPYEKSVDLLSDSPLLQVGLAQAMLATERPELTQPAVDHLEKSLRYDRENSFAFHQLAIGYSRLGDRGMAELSTAERYYIAGNLPQAKQHAYRAQEYLSSGSPNWLRAQDIMNAKG